MLRTKLLIISLILQILKLKKYFNQYAKKSNLCKMLSILTPMSPTALKQYLTKNQTLSEYAICQGKLIAGQQTSSILQPAIKTIYSQLFLKKKMQIKQTIHEISEYIRKKAPSHLKIMDAISEINIYETIRTKFFTTQQLNLTTFQFFKMKNWKKFNLIKNIFYFFRDNQLPQITDQFIEERYLPDGINGIIFGKFKLKNNQVVCTHPTIIGTNKQKIARTVKHQLEFITFKKVIVIAIMTATIATLSIELFNLYRQYCLKSQNDVLKKHLNINVSSRICSICKKQISSIINEQCGHFNICISCFNKNNNQHCLECNKENKNMVEVFIC